MKQFSKDVVHLMKKLLLGYNKFFHNDVLNSDGRKVLETIAKALLHEYPEYKKIVYKVRRNPDLRNVMKLAELVLGDSAYELLSIGIGFRKLYIDKHEIHEYV